ncbi:MAG: D-glycero-beta-D-manno-heptose 1-phosphate adenylyltransferase [Saprospiraceae bacterium]|jgi:rfaE bifunctional protein nucleotidyltransferase chain/domain|nr:D-glycero-beta-D-manno-heptose 1-phosphate adenylyltransferase [Saprospiraceae bacterium]
MTTLRDKVFVTAEYALPLVQEWKDNGERIAFTNGCFDLMHVGHVLYLEESRTLADRLIVGLNADSSVRTLKGQGRPIQDEYNRSHVLAALQSVDMVILFSEDTPYQLIQLISPNILVKGGDWKVEEIVGSDLVLERGGQVYSLKYLEGHSTTNIEQRILQRNTQE